MKRQIFISYRREDSSYAAGRLYDRLRIRFGKEYIFMDIDTIELGVDFVQRIGEAVGACHVLIAIIGKKWLKISDGTGLRRLENPNDFVRLELVSALERDIHIIPALVDGANMPLENDLPEVLKPLARRNGLQIGHTRFDADVDRLIRGLEAIFDDLAKLEAEHIAKEQEEERQAAIKREAERIAKEQEEERQAAIKREAERIAKEQEEERQAAIKREAERIAKEQEEERQAAIKREAERIAKEQEEERQAKIKQEAARHITEVVEDNGEEGRKLQLKNFRKIRLPGWVWFLIMLSILILIGFFASYFLGEQENQDKVQTTEPVIVSATATPVQIIEEDPFVGTWKATDIDGSKMFLTITKDNNSYVLSTIDYGASFCGEDQDGNPLYAGEGNGVGTVAGNKLNVSGTFICQNPSKDTISTDGYLIFNFGSNTLVDENNVLWRR